jgi:hypothetical protein
MLLFYALSAVLQKSQLSNNNNTQRASINIMTFVNSFITEFSVSKSLFENYRLIVDRRRERPSDPESDASGSVSSSSSHPRPTGQWVETRRSSVSVTPAWVAYDADNPTSERSTVKKSAELIKCDHGGGKVPHRAVAPVKMNVFGSQSSHTH